MHCQIDGVVTESSFDQPLPIFLFATMNLNFFRTLPSHRLNNHLVSPISTAKYLGQILHSQLNFDHHVLLLIKKLSRGVGVLSKLRHYLPQPALINVYFAIFHSYLLYGILTWGSTYKAYIAKLQTLQNKAMRIIKGLNWNAPVEDAFYKYQILTARKMYKYEVGKVMYLLNANLLPKSFLDFFPISLPPVPTILVTHQLVQVSCPSFLPIGCNILLNFRVVKSGMLFPII